ncbi:MAG: helix-turn-helix transcriptional regulator [Azonexus sp.]|jgi:transcriptional regulator with XRE-family HTH domain|uniref:helix-turn-helix domain-containing protein n=1 Tax=Azonexus sp. TaxID=1872668 RepID=UPI00281930FC|nr:helix-turn-helix transcriptional regulator [Azonexus sp.]MDR0775953.1 helix-turn-helix transcriptional regulator [Azonexus sp.]
MTHSINTPEMAALLSWLKSAREKQALTMRDLSTRLDKPHSYVQKVEQGERRLDVVEFVWYCEALGINPLQGIKLLAAKKGPLCS